MIPIKPPNFATNPPINSKFRSPRSPFDTDEPETPGHINMAGIKTNVADARPIVVRVVGEPHEPPGDPKTTHNDGKNIVSPP